MKRQNPLQKAYRRIETEGKKHSLCPWCGEVWDSNTADEASEKEVNEC